MSTVNFLKNQSRVLFLMLSFCSLNGCFESSSDSAPLRFKQSQISYHGTTPRNLGLKFSLGGNNERTILAVVTLPEYLDFKNQKLQYRWQLDEGVELIEGQQAGAISVVTSDKKIEIFLRVNNFNVETKKFIRFEASSLVGKNRFFIDGMVSSQSESSFENFVQGIENYKKKVNWNDEK
jgi:hypothetical protein